ncbi:fibronectin type III domain-containing protein [Phaeodactylibacter luteus]|uniref:Fibronectin type-III domain-containing protein n=1 Tax=Phaeodactylibacter luteus TaxID=1564516 RepID=A0A5C6S1Q2_9BACT|nr:hypothetical protein [Phaeodactylibacter luteus]TXB68357.1 hypothetical protein FRY97_02965 [Phaeodactylibacter luteus]
MKQFISFCIGLALCAPLYGQPSLADSTGQPPSLQLILRRQGSDMLLRWAPTTPAAWLKGLNGFAQIERTAFDAFQNFPAASTDTLGGKIRAWSLADFEEAIAQAPENRYLIMAGQSVHGEWETLQAGEPLSMGGIINRHEELRHKYSTALFIADMDPLSAEAMGLFYRDENVPEGKYLNYRVTLFTPTGELYTATALYNPNFDLLATPRIAEAEGLDGYVRLSWDREGHEKYFTAYYIERSLDGERFERVNELPYVNATDEKAAFGSPPITYLAAAENGKNYTYRIIGIDPFGQLSPPSPPVVAQARRLPPLPAPEVLEAGFSANGAMLITWQADSLMAGLEAFSIRKSRTFEGLYRPIGEVKPGQAYRFEDTLASLTAPQYYQVCAVGRAGQERCATPVYGFTNDREPPGAPLGLSGHIDSLGVVRLKWEAGPEPDLAGYQVYTSNSAAGVFMRRNRQLVRATSFTDTLSLGTLTPRVYYRIAAVDLRSNTSSYSKALMLSKPDTIPPAPALFREYEVKDSSISLQWANSNSQDVAWHELKRKREGGDWEVLQRFVDMETAYEDTALLPGQRYVYAIVATDSAGLSAPPVRSIELYLPKPLPSGLRLSAVYAEGQAELSFQFPASGREVAQMVIYRSEGEGPFRKWSVRQQGIAFKTTDKDVARGNTYRYKFRLLYRDGGRSGYSNTATLQF